jgi:hypothetical protein
VNVKSIADKRIFNKLKTEIPNKDILFLTKETAIAKNGKAECVFVFCCAKNTALQTKILGKGVKNTNNTKRLNT